eukprot:Nk52_evm2s162 gene=Nk52_evmTU2s162
MRDRMAELRQAAAGNSGNGSPHTALTVDALPEEDFMTDFFHQVAELRKQVDESEKIVQSINKSHGEALSSVSTKDGKECEQRLEQLKSEFGALSRKIRNDLKRIQVENKSLEKKDPGSANARVRRTQHAQISKKFMNVITVFNEVEESFKGKYEDRVKRQLRTFNPELSEEQVNSFAAGGMSSGFLLTMERTVSHSQAHKDLENLKERNNDLMKIEKSLTELREMFADLATLVEQQGEAVDSIEFNVAQSSEFTEEAVADLKSAKVSMFRARKAQIAIGACLLILILIVVIVIVQTLK